MRSHVISLTISISTFSRIRSSGMIKNIFDKTKISLTVALLSSFPNISISTLLTTKHAHACQKQDGYILHDILFYFTLEAIYLKYLKSIQ